LLHPPQRARSSAGRHLTRADDNEMLLLRVPELLRAR